MIFNSVLNRYKDKRDCYRRQLFPLVEEFESLTSDDYILASEDDVVSVPPLACSFCPVPSSCHLLSLVDENGFLVLYNTLFTGPRAILTEWQAHNNAIFDVAWMHSEEKIVTASGDQTAVLWDPETSKRLEVFKGHTSSLRSVAFRRFDDSVLATGSRDGHVMLYDKRCAQKDGYIPPINVIRNAHAIQGLKSKKRSKLGQVMDSQQSVTAVAFQSDMLLISSGAVDGCIKVWDLRKNYTALNSDPVARYSFPYAGPRASKHGFSSLTVDSYGANLFANCTDDIIYQYDLITYNQQPVRTFRGHQNQTFYIKSSLSPDNDFLLSGSSDSMAYIWEIDKPNHSPVVLKGHKAEVTSVSWNCSDFTKLATLSDDNSMKLWRLLRRVKPPLFGEVAGTAERTHREIGTSTIPVAKETPKKPTCPQKEFSPLSQPRSSPGACSPSLGKSPSIKDWFKKHSSKDPKTVQNVPVYSQQVHLQSPQKPTFHPSPRKASRLKLDEEEEEAGYFQSTSIAVPFEAYVEKENKRSPKKTSKRKLDIGEATSHESKRRHIEKSSPSKSDVVLRDLETELNNAESVGSCDITSEGGVKNSHLDRCVNSEKGLVFSPTRNLPNLVVDETEARQDRLSLVMASPSQNKKCLDWLTQMRLNKGILPSPAKSVTSEDDFSARSDCSSPGRSITRTPVKGMKSIRNYFQRSAEKKPRK